MRVLWLDNDIAQTEPYVRALERTSNKVTVTKSIGECEDLLKAAKQGDYDLLILDVMIPTKNAAEEERYTPQSTERGTVTGLAVWKQWSEQLKQMGTKVMVLTVRLDQTIRDEFVRAGFPREAFATKMDLRDTDDFVKRVTGIVNQA